MPRCVRLVAAAALLLTAGLLWAQVTGTVTGIVMDKSGAVVANAAVELREVGTNAPRTTKTNDAGQYTISSVPPGDYKLSVSAPNFRQAVIPNLRVAVGRSTSANVTLEVGQVTQIVEVQAGTATELQTLDAAVGNVIGSHALQNMPTLSRDATALLLLQPLAVPAYNGSPGSGSDNSTAGGVAGSRMDQNTFLVDGGDATSNTEAGGGYNTGFAGTPRAAVPTPVESLEEFRVTTNNQINFARSAGGEVQMVTRRGNNSFHGAAYEYNQNTIYNANLWELNHTGQPRPAWQDNRFGGRIGGPIIKDKTFFFLHYEGRRFKKGEPFTRQVPSALMRQGILSFNGVQYDLKTSTACGGPCDPRGIGLNPVVAAIWSKLPQGNNPSVGDGVNTIGFTTSVPIISNEEFGVARFDQKITSNWDFMASYRYSVADQLSSAQVDITGGVARAVNSRPLQPRYLVAGLTGRLSNSMTNDFRFNFLRHWWEWRPVRPSAQVPGTAEALTIGSESRTAALIPVNFDTQNARGRVWNGKDLTFNDQVSWIKGNHLVQFGGEARRQHFLHLRDDKVLRGLVDPVYQVLQSNNIDRDSIPKPGGLSTSQQSRWNNFYDSVMGMVDFATVLRTRAGDLSPNPPGTRLKQDAIVNSYQLNFSDSWKMTPTFTLTYGLTWGVQLPPYETEGRATMITDLATGKIVDFDQYLKQRVAAAEQGKVFNPQLGFATMKALGRKYPYDVDWHNFGPRLAFAWNPSVTGDSFLSRFFGDRKTVIRGGYSRMFDRMNGVGIVMTPALGIGFGNQLSCRGPRVTGTCGGSGSTPLTAFRIGIDGTSVPLPTLSPIQSPLVPGVNSPFEVLDFRIDPHRKVGVEETFTLSVQREMPWNSLIEVGYVGRLGRHLPHGVGLNQIPYMFKAGGQTFADAYDNIAIFIRNGGDPAAVPVQPWFEAMHGGACPPFPSCTAAVAVTQSGNFLDGIVNDLVGAIEGGFTFTDTNGVDFDEPGFVTGPLTADFDQFLDSNITTSNGTSNYNAGYLSFRKATSAGLSFTANYTWSRSMDLYGLNQESVGNASDTFNLKRDYGPSLFDRRHIFNFFFNYDLPFGRRKRFSATGALDKLIGGWSMSGIYTASSALPAFVYNGGSFGEDFGQGGALGNFSHMVPIKPLFFTSSDHYAADGTVNAFADPAAVMANFRRPLFSDLRLGRGNVRGFSRWNFDFDLAKSIQITERVKTRLDLQVINLFNVVQFRNTNAVVGDVDLDLSNPDNFGAVSTQYNTPRFLSIGLRFDF